MLLAKNRRGPYFSPHCMPLLLPQLTRHPLQPRPRDHLVPHSVSLETIISIFSQENQFKVIRTNHIHKSRIEDYCMRCAQMHACRGRWGVAKLMSPGWRMVEGYSKRGGALCA